MNQTTDPQVDKTGIPTDDELRLALVRTAGLHHQLLTIVMTVIRLVLVLGGIVVAVRVADGIFG
jgi:hypothetical protein